jgi:hypothetical protein
VTENLNTDLDAPLWGAKAFGPIVKLDERAIYYALERGFLDADKFGDGRWVSTKRRLLKSLGIEAR